MTGGMLQKQMRQSKQYEEALLRNLGNATGGAEAEREKLCKRAESDEQFVTRLIL